MRDKGLGFKGSGTEGTEASDILRRFKTANVHRARARLLQQQGAGFAPASECRVEGYKKLILVRGNLWIMYGKCKYPTVRPPMWGVGVER